MKTQENPVGTNGFAFVEFASKEPKKLEQDFLKLGFAEVARHKDHAIKLFRQNEINFLLNESLNSYAVDFSAKHGAAAIGMGWRVHNAEFAKQHAIKMGAKAISAKNSLDLPMIEGVGGSLLYFIDDAKLKPFFEEEFIYHDAKNSHPVGAGLSLIDHLTHNVHQGQMDVWANFYEKIFNFHQIKYFHIEGKMTGLESRAMTSPCGKIRIPINESKDNKSQIVEFIEEFKGEGIQHIALSTADIYQSVTMLRKNGIQFLATPDSYFDMISARLPWQHEDKEKLKALKILIDGEKTPDKGLLLQIFTENMLGPVFFEIIQRKGNEGFGEGNFQALFEAIERDQMLRGKL